MSSVLAITSHWHHHLRHERRRLDAPSATNAKNHSYAAVICVIFVFVRHVMMNILQARSPQSIITVFANRIMVQDRKRLWMRR